MNRLSYYGLLTVLLSAGAWLFLGAEKEATKTSVQVARERADVDGTNYADRLRVREQYVPSTGTPPALFPSPPVKENASAEAALTERDKAKAPRVQPASPNTGRDFSSHLSEQEEDLLMAQRQNAQIMLFEHTLSSEAPDPNWSRHSEMDFKASMAKLDNKLAVGDFYCAASLCRLRTTIESDGDPSMIIRTLTGHALWEGEIFLTVDPTGAAVAYLGRPGKSLPQIQP